MEQPPDARTAFQTEVFERFGILPNFFRSAEAAPELIEQLWAFARAAYIDNPIPALFKERLFVTLSRLCPMRYCIVRHVGFLLGDRHGRAAGEAGAVAHSISEVIHLLKRQTPWQRDMSLIYRQLEVLEQPLAGWPEPETEMEDLLFACATVIFAEPVRGNSARTALLKSLGPRNFEYLAGFLAFVRTAHYWTLLHPEIETEEDMQTLLRDHEELARLLMEDPEADRCEMGTRVFDELVALRDLHERQELRKAKEELEEKDRQKDQFIAVLAHEIRNPLSVIAFSIELLRRINPTDQAAGKMHERIEHKCRAMTQMLDDLFDVALLTTAKARLLMENLDFRGFVRDVLDENEQRYKSTAIELVFEELSTEKCTVRGDPVRLHQIIDNLLSNALKFTPEPGRVSVWLRTEGSSAILQVSDTGVGFDSDVATQLFESFVQDRNLPDGLSKGLGLGLAIAKKFAELHEGELTGYSEGPGHGAVFTLTLPLVSNYSVDQ